MKEIFQQYGAVVLAAAVGLAIMTLVFAVSWNGKKGVNGAAGEVVEQQTRDILQDDNVTSAYRSYGNVSVESITFQSGNPIRAGSTVRMEEYFLAKASDGNMLSYRILGICDREGARVGVTLTQDGSFATFPKAGIYRVYIRTQSEGIRAREAVIAFPVEAAV